MCIPCRGYRLYKSVSDEPADGEPHEEMLERHEFFKINGKGCEKYGESERAEHCRKIEHFDIDIRRKPEIHCQLISENGCEPDGKQGRVFQAHDLDPPEYKRAAEQSAEQFAEGETCGRHGPIAEHGGRECGLERFRGGAHDFEHEEKSQHRIELPVFERGRVNIRVTDMPHSPDTYRQCHWPRHAYSAEDIAVKPVIVFTVSKDPDAFEQDQ